MPASSSSRLFWVRVQRVTCTKLVGVTWIAEACGGMIALMPQ
jgi:hypothetical protein